MKKSITTSLLISTLFLGFTFHALSQVPDSWTHKSDFGGTARYGSTSFSIEGKGYIGLGYGVGRLKDFWAYDPVTDTWSQVADFGGTARFFAAGFSIGSKGYVGTGNDGIQKNDFWEYNPSTNVWTQKANFGGIPRDAAVGLSIGLKGYMGTGELADAFDTKLNDFWEYDPSTDIWTQKSNVGTFGRSWAAAFSIGNKGYIGTGATGVLSKSFLEYNPATDSWTAKANFAGSGRFGAIGCSNGTNGYIGLGDIGLAGYSNDFWEYIPSTDLWVQRTNFGGHERTTGVAFSINDKIYAGTGNYNSGATKTKDFWEYTPFCIPPSVSVQPISQSINYGGSASFTVSANEATSYQWQEDAGSGFVDIADGGLYSNTSTATLSITMPGTAMNGYKYRCVITGACVPVATTDGTATLLIAPLPITIYPNAGQGKTYGDSDPALFTYSYSPSLIGPDVITGLMGRDPGEDAGSYLYNVGSLSAGSNYAITVASSITFTISPFSITVTPAPGQTKVYGSADPAVFQYSYAPALFGSDAISGYLGRVPGEIVGSYAFTPGTLSAGSNYAISIAATSAFSITPLSIVITPDAGQTKVYGSPDPAIFLYSYTPSLIGSDAITGLMGRVAGESAGAYAFELGTLNAGSNYLMSVSGNINFTITPLAITVTPNSGQSKEYGATEPGISYSVMPFLLPGDNFTGSLSRIVGENVGLYPILLGTLSGGNNYSINLVSEDFAITPRSILISANTGQSKVYGSPDPALFTFTASPALIGSDNFSGSLNRLPGENAGSYAFTLGSLSAGINYILSVAASPAFSISPKNLSISADNKSKCYDGTVYSNGFTATYNGFANNETQSVLDGTLIYTGSAISAVDPGSYSIIPSGLTSSNYSIIYVAGTLNIETSPVPSITGSSSVCAGITGVHYTTEPGFSNYVWTISYGGVITGGLNTNQVTVSWGTAGSRSISVNYENPTGCFASSITSKNVTVLSVPVPIISGEISVCSGNSGVVYSTQVNYENYIWTVSPGGIITSGAGTPTITVEWTGSGNQTVSVSYTNNSGCQSIEPAVLNVNVAPKPGTAGQVTGPASVCAGSTGLVYSVVPVTSATSYEWNLPAGASISSGNGTSSIVVDFGSGASSGIILVKGVNDCGSGIPSAGFNVQVNPIPSKPTITQHGDTLISSSETGNQWFLDNVSIPGATGKIHVAVYSGTYYVEVTHNECTSLPSESLLVLPVSVKDRQSTSTFTIYPNPGSGLFKLKFGTERTETYSIEIFNSIGALIWKQEDVHVNGIFTTEIDLVGKPAGIYTLALRSKSETVFRKFIITL